MRVLRPLLTLVVAAASVAACAPAGMSPAIAPAAVRPAGTLVDVGQGRASAELTPQVATGGRRLMAQVQENTQATINHLVVKIYEGTSPGTYVTEVDIPAAGVGNAITFVGLRDNRTYRVRAYAYATAGQADKISVDGGSFTDIVVTNDDRPTVANLPVQLSAVPFAGRATATGVDIQDGGHLTAGAEMITMGEPLTTNSYVDTFTGDGSQGYLDGDYTTAKFDTPFEVAAVGLDLFVADKNNHVIRRVNADGDVSTFAGAAGQQGTADGTGAAARFDNPTCITADRAGNLYVFQAGSGAYPPTQLIRKITPAGVVTTIAGGPRDGAASTTTGASARFADVYDLAVDPAGTYLYVGDAHNQVIRRIDLQDPQFTTVIIAGAQNQTGSSDNATGTAARFLYPGHLAVDLDGDVIVTDSNPKVRKIDVQTAGFPVTTIAGHATLAGIADGDATTARFRAIADVAVDAQGNILVLDNGDGNLGDAGNRLRKITLGAGGTVSVGSLAGQGFGHVDGLAFISGAWGNPRGMTFNAVGELFFIEGGYIRWVYPDAGA